MSVLGTFVNDIRCSLRVGWGINLDHNQSVVRGHISTVCRFWKFNPLCPIR